MPRHRTDDRPHGDPVLRQRLGDLILLCWLGSHHGRGSEVGFRSALRGFERVRCAFSSPLGRPALVAANGLTGPRAKCARADMGNGYILLMNTGRSLQPLEF